MEAVFHLAALRLRARWRGWAALAVLAAVAGGAVLAAAAGASRTDTAYPRFLATSRASDLLVSPLGSNSDDYVDAIASLPGVAASAGLAGLSAGPVSSVGVIDYDATMFAPLDGNYGHTVDIPKMLAGRLPGPDAPGEIAVTQIAAQELNLHVGSVLRVVAMANAPHSRPRLLTERVSASSSPGAPWCP
jgi:putative ABC transport system permease protein